MHRFAFLLIAVMLGPGCASVHERHSSDGAETEELFDELGVSITVPHTWTFDGTWFEGSKGSIVLSSRGFHKSLEAAIKQDEDVFALLGKWERVDHSRFTTDSGITGIRVIHLGSRFIHSPQRSISYYFYNPSNEVILAKCYGSEKGKQTAESERFVTNIILRSLRLRNGTKG